MHKPRILQINPILPSQDIAISLEFWQKLGFSNVFDSTDYSEHPLNYAVLCRDSLCVHLQLFEDIEKQHSPQIRFQVQSIEVLLEEFKTSGVLDKNAVLRTTPWNTREFGLFDPDKSGITFFESIKS